MLTLPLDMLSTENIVSDGFYGCCVVTCTLCAFISLVWLREQILRGGGPDWLDQQGQIQNAVAQIQDAGHVAADPVQGANDNNNDEGIGDDEDNDNDVVDDEAGAQVNNGAAAGPQQHAHDLQMIDNNVNGVNANAAANADVAAAQDWNPAVEWDRAAEELTWERVNVACILMSLH